MQETKQPERLDLSAFTQKVGLVRSEIARFVVGQTDAVDLLLSAILADGHVLIEGVPGIAKTLLAKVMARLIDARFTRLQFTPDLMPSDVLGTTIFDQRTQDFTFRRGPVFTQLLLVDEINRAPAKTQAALFEVMEERQATIDGQTYPMDNFFCIFATQNPVEQEGTYKLPEAQLDRFVLKVSMSYPTSEQEVEILRRHQERQRMDLNQLTPALTPAELTAMRALLDSVVVDEAILRYITAIVQLTRTSRNIYLSASPRASVALLRLSKAYALLCGRDFVIPDDVKRLAPAVLSHRLVLTAEAEMEGFSIERVVQDLLQQAQVDAQSPTPPPAPPAP
ncbi:MAG: MoxR family ATPase [Alloprevotella sp.]|nr:MoxR family ATPase [Alloprevotella sp.]